MPADISEYVNQGHDGLGQLIPAGLEPANVIQQIAVGGASVQSAPFSTATRMIRVHTDVPLRFSIGSDPTASATTPRMAAHSTEFFSVRGGHRIAFISTT